MKLEHVAWLRMHQPQGTNKTVVSVSDSDAPGAFKVYRAIPDGYVVVPVERVLSQSELTQIDLWRDSAQDRYCYDPPKSEIDLQAKLEAMIAAKEQS